MNSNTTNAITAISMAAVAITLLLVALKGCQITTDVDIGKIKECVASGGEYRPITVPTTTTVYMSCVKPPK